MTNVEKFEAMLLKIPDENPSVEAANADALITDDANKKLFQIYTCLKPSKTNVPNFDKAYEIVVEVLVDCLNEYNKNQNLKKNKLHTIPLKIRKAIYFIVYANLALNFGFDRNKKKVTKNGYQVATIREINKKGIELTAGKNLVVHISEKSFNKDKWCMHPYQDFKDGVTYTPPSINMNYAGKKNGVYGYMISELTRQVDYKYFADIFAGSGQAFMNVEPRDGVEEYINDFDWKNYNFFEVISNNFSDFVNMCNSISKDISSKPDQKEYALKLWNYYMNICKTCPNKKGDLLSAFAFYFIHNFLYNGIKVSKSGVSSTNIKKFLSINFYGELKSFSDRLKPVIKINKNAIDFLGSSQINRSDALVYSDSPYIATTGYDKGFTKMDMHNLIEKLRDFKGNFIFSCRPSVAKRHTEYDEWDSCCLDIQEKKDRKVNIAREKISQVFYWFNQFKLQADKQLYVLLTAEKGRTTERELRFNISQNYLMEIMITDIDFKELDYNLCLENNNYDFSFQHDKLFRKMTYEEFYYIAMDELLKHDREFANEQL